MTPDTEAIVERHDDCESDWRACTPLDRDKGCDARQLADALTAAEAEWAAARATSVCPSCGAPYSCGGHRDGR